MAEASGYQVPPVADAHLGLLGGRYGLGDEALQQLRCLLVRLAGDPLAPTSVRDPVKVADDHLADSLVALEAEEVVKAEKLVDIGAGAGLPGLPLAVACPESEFVLLESSGRKCAFLADAAARCGVRNAAVVNARAEEWPEGLRSHDVALARALAPLPVVLEYAAPLLRPGGAVVVWRGRRDEAAEAAAERAARELGLEPAGIRRVEPHPGVEHRYLHLWLKVTETPARFPRRPGIALKRPLGGERRPSDRARR